MSRTTIVPTVQTKANQNTDLYLKANGGGTITGNLVVDGNIELASINDILEFPVDAAAVSQGCIRFSESVTGNLRWQIGKSATETGVGNAGSDLSFFAYSDAGGIILSPLTITRSSGNVTMRAGAAVATTLNVGLQAGTGTINVVGPSGASQVYDGVYNRPGPTDYLFNQNGILIAGLTNPITTGQNQSAVTFTPTKTGMYLIEATVGASGSTWTAAFGDKVQIVLEPVPAVPGVLPASSGVIMMSNGTGFTAWTSMSCDKLVAGVSYTIAANFENNSTTMANNNDEIIFDLYITQLC